MHTFSSHTSSNWNLLNLFYNYDFFNATRNRGINLHHNTTISDFNNVTYYRLGGCVHILDFYTNLLGILCFGVTLQRLY